MNCIKVRIYLKEMVEPETENPWIYQQFSKVSIVSIGLRWILDSPSHSTVNWYIYREGLFKMRPLKSLGWLTAGRSMEKNTNISLALTLHSCFQGEDGHNYPDNLPDKWVTKKAEKTLVSKRLWRFMMRLWLV